MLAFQVVSRTAPGLAPPKRQRRRFSPTWIAIYRIFRSMTVSALLFVLVLRLTGSNYTFVLLPTFLSVFIANSRRFPLDQIIHSTPLYLIITASLALVYYSVVTAVVMIPHSLAHSPDIIFVTTALAWAIILQPAYLYFQLRVEGRFNKRNIEANKAVEAFTSSLRDEIDLDQLRDRFLTVTQQTMQPYAVALWLREAQRHKQGNMQQAMEVLVGDDDPFIAHALRHLGALDVSRLPQESPLAQAWQTQGMEIVLPLATQGDLIGLLLVSMRLDGEDYSLEDRTLLGTLGAEVAPALRVAQLVQEQQEQVREHERIEQELRTAQAIQRDFLPKEIPTLPGWQFTPYYQPAREVGGDFYDFIELADGRLGLVIGDVTGKGMPAALVMATVHSILRSAAHHTRAPRDVLAEVNALLLPDLPPNMYVTCFYAILDPASGGLRYANAGHELPFHRQGARVRELRATGMPLGLLADTSYDEAEALLQPGDDVVFYSDGIVEAHNPRREMFGEKRLEQLIGAHAEGPDLIDGVLADLVRFSGTDWEQEDDITLVAVRRSANDIAPDMRVLDSWILPSVAGADRQAMQRAGAVARKAGLSAERCERLETAVSEATLNAMEHGNANQGDKPISFQVLATPDTLIVRVGDQGDATFDPDTPQPDIEAMLAGEQSPRGWGLFLMRSMVDEVRLDTTSGQHVIELRMALDA